MLHTVLSSSESLTADRDLRRAGAASTLLIAIGVLLRLAKYFSGRPLWEDEAFLALNILSRSFTEFLSPLDSMQISPIGFLWIEWAVIGVGGASEYALRLSPLVAGCLTLVGVSRFASRTLGRDAALITTALVALSPMLIHYSSEVKSYAFDALFTILMMHASLDIAASEGRNPTPFWRRWALCGAVTSLFSTAAPFIVAGCACALIADPLVRRRHRIWQRLAMASAPAAVFFALQFFTMYQSPETTTFMQSYWSNSFLERRLGPAVVEVASVMRTLWLSITFGGDAESFLPPKSMTVVLAFSSVGLMAMLRRNVFLVLLLVAPIGLAIGASFAQIWPLTPRLLLFTFPLVLATLAEGLSAVTRVIAPRARSAVMLAVSGPVLLAAIVGDVKSHQEPLLFRDVPAALEYVHSNLGGSATVYVVGHHMPACDYYSVWHPDRMRLTGESGARGCSLRGARTIHGSWAEQFSTPSVETDTARFEWSWAQRELALIQKVATVDVWLLLTSGPSPLVTAVENAGMTRVAQREFRGVTVHHYHFPSARPRSSEQRRP